MLSTVLGPIKGDRKILRAHRQHDTDGALVCCWGPEHLAALEDPPKAA
jgi:hypothetical protein